MTKKRLPLSRIASDLAKMMQEVKKEKQLPPPNFLNIVVIVGIIFGIIGVAIALRAVRTPEAAKHSALPDTCNSRAFAEIGGPFELVNQDNQTVTNLTFMRRPTLIYFGFTYCPDICPLTLQSMTLSLEEATKAGGRDIDDIQPILISLDPERDTPAALKTYVASSGFPKGLIGLTGTPEQVKAAASSFKVGYSKSVPKGNDPKDYLVDHTSIVYLMGRDGKLRTFFANDPDPKEVGQCIAALSKSGL